MTAPRTGSSADRLDDVVRTALTMARDARATAVERTQMLMEIAIGLQRRPKTRLHLTAAVELYDEALALCPQSERLLHARITARKGTALQAIPDEGTALLEQALVAYEQALCELERAGTPEEVAEAQMNRGLVLQHLAGCGKASIRDAIDAYQRSLRTFQAKRYPVEFAILQNNLATAFLALPFTDERAQIREALAVRCFEDALGIVNRNDHPAEYAMLQNNLGNALQYASSSHALENNLRAIDAYDEALKVRTRLASPLEYASTLANKANCLRNLGRFEDARTCYREAQALFAADGERDKSRILMEALATLEAEATQSS